RGPLPGRALGRPAAARRDRARPRARPEGDALRRADLRARRRARGRGAGRHAAGRGVRDDDGDRHPRAPLRTRDRRLQRLHGRGLHRRVGPSRLLRQLHEPAHETVHGGRVVMLAVYDWHLAWINRGGYEHALATTAEVASVALLISVVVGLT